MKVDVAINSAKAPNYEGFSEDMFADVAYQRVAKATTAKRTAEGIENFFASHSELWTLLALFWKGMIWECPQTQRPTEAEAARWQEIANRNNMPISFRDGMLRHVIPLAK